MLETNHQYSWKTTVTVSFFQKYFIISDVKESISEIVIYLKEKNEIPGEYSNIKVDSKGFYNPVVVQDFPIPGKKLFLNIHRRRWIVKEDGCYVSHNWKLVAEGSP